MFACLELLKDGRAIFRRKSGGALCVSSKCQKNSRRQWWKERTAQAVRPTWAIICASRADFVFFFDTWVWIEFRTADMQIVFKF